MLIPEFESFKQLLEKLKNRAEKAVVVVEGKKDMAALKALMSFDFLGETDTDLVAVHATVSPPRSGDIRFVLTYKNKRSLQKFAEEIASEYREAIIMLDTDKKGMELTKKLTSYLHKNAVRTDRKIAERMLGLAGCQTVESLDCCKLVRGFF